MISKFFRISRWHDSVQLGRDNQARPAIRRQVRAWLNGAERGPQALLSEPFLAQGFSLRDNFAAVPQDAGEIQAGQYKCAIEKPLLDPKSERADDSAKACACETDPALIKLRTSLNPI